MRGHVASAALAVAVVAVRPAVGLAYCRATTCDPEKEACPLDDNGCVDVGVSLLWNKCPTNHGESCIATARYLKWSESCVSFNIAASGTKQIEFNELEAAVTAGFDAWSNVVCPNGRSLSMKLTYLGPVLCDAAIFNRDPKIGNANVVRVMTPWTHFSNVLALTTSTFSTVTGRVLDADIEINGDREIATAFAAGAQAADVQSILTHEAGHFLGLAHTRSVEYEDAVMVDAHETGTTRRALTNDDIAGICSVYPADRIAAAGDCRPLHGFTSECSGEVGGGCCSTVPGTRRRHEQRHAAFLTLFAISVVAARRLCRSSQGRS